MQIYGCFHPLLFYEYYWWDKAEGQMVGMNLENMTFWLVTVTLIAPNTSHVFSSFLDMLHLLTLLPIECPCEVMLCCSLMSVDIFVKNTKFIKWVWIHFLTVIVPVRSKVVQIWWSVLEWQQFQPITLIAFTPIMIFWVKSLTKITEYSELNSFLFNYNSLLKCLQWANKYKSAQNIFYNSQQNKTCGKKEKTDTFIFVFVSALKKHCY